jgi:hypothetical protein
MLQACFVFIVSNLDRAPLVMSTAISIITLALGSGAERGDLAKKRELLFFFFFFLSLGLIPHGFKPI